MNVIKIFENKMDEYKKIKGVPMKISHLITKEKVSKPTQQHYNNKKTKI